MRTYNEIHNKGLSIEVLKAELISLFNLRVFMADVDNLEKHGLSLAVVRRMCIRAGVALAVGASAALACDVFSNFSGDRDNGSSSVPTSVPPETVIPIDNTPEVDPALITQLREILKEMQSGTPATTIPVTKETIPLLIGTDLEQSSLTLEEQQTLNSKIRDDYEVTLKSIIQEIDRSMGDAGKAYEPVILITTSKNGDQQKYLFYINGKELLYGGKIEKPDENNNIFVSLPRESMRLVVKNIDNLMVIMTKGEENGEDRTIVEVIGEDQEIVFDPLSEQPILFANGGQPTPEPKQPDTIFNAAYTATSPDSSAIVVSEAILREAGLSTEGGASYTYAVLRDSQSGRNTSLLIQSGTSNVSAMYEWDGDRWEKVTLEELQDLLGYSEASDIQLAIGRQGLEIRASDGTVLAVVNWKPVGDQGIEELNADLTKVGLEQRARVKAIEELAIYGVSIDVSRLSVTVDEKERTVNIQITIGGVPFDLVTIDAVGRLKTNEEAVIALLAEEFKLPGGDYGFNADKTAVVNGNGVVLLKRGEDGKWGAVEVSVNMAPEFRETKMETEFPQIVLENVYWNGQDGGKNKDGTTRPLTPVIWNNKDENNNPIDPQENYRITSKVWTLAQYHRSPELQEYAKKYAKEHHNIDDFDQLDADEQVKILYEIFKDVTSAWELRYPVRHPGSGGKTITYTVTAVVDMSITNLSSCQVGSGACVGPNWADVDLFQTRYAAGAHMVFRPTPLANSPTGVSQMDITSYDFGNDPMGTGDWNDLPNEWASQSLGRWMQSIIESFYGISYADVGGYNHFFVDGVDMGPVSNYDDPKNPKFFVVEYLKQLGLNDVLMKSGKPWGVLTTESDN